MADIVDIAGRQERYDGFTCSCGSAWFTVQAVTLDTLGAHITSWAAPLTCHGCGRVWVDGAWTRPDLTSAGQPADKSEGLEDAGPLRAHRSPRRQQPSGNPSSPETRCCTSHHFEGCTDGGPGCCARCPINPTDDEGAST